MRKGESVKKTSNPIPEQKQSVDPATQSPISTQPLVSKETRKTTTLVGILVTVVVVVILAGLGYLMYAAYDWAPDGITPATVRLRDISFIVIAIETLILLILTLVVIVLLVILVVLVYDRVIPILEQLNKTMNTVVETTETVRGTTTFVSEKVVSPFIEVSSYAAGIARIGKGILDLFPRRSAKSQER